MRVNDLGFFTKAFLGFVENHILELEDSNVK